ncbi:hypothetical protein AeRB84_012302 [Aphanomyces euteiches]|nr:hypothetical protein AeRB84_012302 [Aphanomyces euteiches]
MSRQAIRSVLTSADIFPYLMAYQHGLSEDFLPFLPLRNVLTQQGGPKQAKFFISRYIHVVHRWYIYHGAAAAARLERLVLTLPWTCELVFLYGIYVGDKEIVTAPALESYRRWTASMPRLVAAAVASDNVFRAIECLECFCLNRMDILVGVGDAVSRGRPLLAEYLAARNEKGLLASSFQRRRIHDHLQEIYRSNHLEYLPWLLQFWDRWFPPRWKTHNLQECCKLAMEHQLWNLLVDFTKCAKLQYKEAMLYAAQESLIVAVEWLVENTWGVIDHTHIVAAAKAWRPDDKTSEKNSTACSPFGSRRNVCTESKRHGIAMCMEEAMKQPDRGLMDFLLTTNALEYMEAAMSIAMEIDAAGNRIHNPKPHINWANLQNVEKSITQP